MYMLPLRHKEEYFVKYQDIPLAKPTDGPSMESVSWMIFGDECVGRKCIDMTVTQSTT